VALLALGCGGDDDAAAGWSDPASGASATAGATQAGATQVGNAPGIPPLGGAVQHGAEGLQYIEEQPGKGDAIRAGQRVTVHYTGWLTNGRKFDSSRDRGQPFSFVVGAREVIGGWDQGVATMRVGGKRRLIVPPGLGYGARGYPPTIPANATLIFDVEVLAAQ
jgi:FKBP-type peptidyl-prolyl cis-trans isomerase